LRCDKLILSALQTTVDLYLSGSALSEDQSSPLPTLEMLRWRESDLQARARKILEALAGLATRRDHGPRQSAD
jgi:seryl-tRNA(Sec) selenium transferase